jgi:hypothetical protein
MAQEVSSLPGFSHVTKVACFLLESLSDSDLKLLEAVAYQCPQDVSSGHMSNEGCFIYIGQDNCREYWEPYSDELYAIVEACEKEGYEWLRFLP